MYDLEKFMAEVERKNPAQPEFIQAAREVVASVIDTVNSNPMYLKNKIYSLSLLFQNKLYSETINFAK